MTPKPTSNIQFGDGLSVIDLGGGTIRVDAGGGGGTGSGGGVDWEDVGSGPLTMPPFKYTRLNNLSYESIAADASTQLQFPVVDDAIVETTTNRRAPKFKQDGFYAIFATVLGVDIPVGNAIHTALSVGGFIAYGTPGVYDQTSGSNEIAIPLSGSGPFHIGDTVNVVVQHSYGAPQSFLANMLIVQLNTVV